MSLRVLVLASVLFVGCGGNFRGGIVPVSDCAADLLDHGYIVQGARYPRRSAEKICSDYTAEQIATAKSLMTGKYESEFSTALRDVKDIPNDQLECAKKEHDATQPGRPSVRMIVSDTCRQVSLTRPADPSTTAAGGGDLVEALTTSGHFSKLLKALEAAKLTDSLKAAGPYTLFAPNDQAFAKMSDKDFERLLKDSERVRRVLLFHIVQGSVTSASLPQPEGFGAKRHGISKRLATLNGRVLFITQEEGFIKVDRAKVINADVHARNGLIYEIDEVMHPT